MPVLPIAVLAAVCWLPPVEAPITDPFRPPACAWCAGNRGIEYATVPGTPVRAVAAGTVTFAGSIAGTVYLVVRLADGRRVTYGGLDPLSLRPGDPVAAGAVIGLTDRPLHLGLRAAAVEGDPESAERYVDPAPWIGHLAGRPRLLPVDGTPPRPAPPPRLTCPAERPRVP